MKILKWIQLLIVTLKFSKLVTFWLTMNFMIEIKVTAATILRCFKTKFISYSFYMYWNICLMKTPFQKKEDKIWSINLTNYSNLLVIQWEPAMIITMKYFPAIYSLCRLSSHYICDPDTKLYHKSKSRLAIANRSVSFITDMATWLAVTVWSFSWPDWRAAELAFLPIP